jgi:hypothetical protein
MKKFTREYADNLATSDFDMPIDYQIPFVGGYMKAIEETNAPELLEVLNKIVNAMRKQGAKETSNDLFKQAINAINKATL